MRALEIRRLGVVSYGDGLALQRELVEERRADRIPDTLLLLEHPHVITLGVKARGTMTNVVASRDTLAAQGVELFETGRGGDVTYHGPGQLVGYPILDLRPDRCDVHRYVRDLEEVLIRVTGDYGFAGMRIPGCSGAWVAAAPVGAARPLAAKAAEACETFAGLDSPEKIAAIGVRISRWITSHGFALNVNTDLRYFNLIVPCGIADKGVTSLARLRGGPVSLEDVIAKTARRFAEVFDRELAADELALATAYTPPAPLRPPGATTMGG